MSTPTTNGEAVVTSNPALTIYVGNLDQRVTDGMLNEIFSTIGPVTSVKIMTMRRHGPYGAVNYGFVEFADRTVAEAALLQMNRRKIFNYEIKVNWAQPGQGTQVKEDTASHFHVFVGDLSPDINDEMLSKAFSAFTTMSDAHVMWDAVSGNSRGFGFVAFRDKTDAEQAIATMNGEWLGARAIRCNWATQKGQTATPPPQPGQQLPYEVVVQQTPAYVTTVYVGNLPPTTSQADLMQYFERFGYVVEVKLQAERGFAFVKMNTHENAANALVQLQNMSINGRQAKLSWGKDRPQPGWQAYGHANSAPAQAGVASSPVNGNGVAVNSNNGGYQAQANWHANNPGAMGAMGSGGVGHYNNNGNNQHLHQHRQQHQQQQQQYSGRAHPRHGGGSGFPQQITNGYAFSHAAVGGSNSLENLNTHGHGAQQATHAQWNQQQQNLYDQYNSGTPNI
ncbi:hypothetical protein F4703DRAFT_1848620 [Phycomyces blakesleeanus]